MKNKIFIEYKQHSYGGEPESNEAYCSRSDEHTEVSFLGAHKDKDSIGAYCNYTEVEVDFEPKKGDIVYFLVVRYQTGDTFGASYGNWETIGCYDNADQAVEIEKSIEVGTYGKDEEKDDYCLYHTWEGYFESLESVDIEVFEVL